MAKVGGLRVASRTSVFALKGKPQDVRAIGALLGVSAVLEGSRSQGGRPAAHHGAAHRRRRRQPALVPALRPQAGRRVRHPGRNRADHREHAADDLLAEVTDPTPRRYTESLVAYGLYLRGRYSWNKRNAEGVLEAITYFEQAIAADPKYALAYSGLADSYALQVDYRRVPVAEGLNRAREYARQALALDDTIAEAHTSLGWVLFIYDWDWHAAARTFRRAVELNPGYATGRQWYSFVLAALGHVDQALVEGHAALELDPASVSIRRSLGWLYYYARRFDTALDHLRRAIAMNPTSQETYRLLGLALTQQGSYDQAERALREAIAIPEESSYAPAALGYLLARRGDRTGAEAIIAELEVRSRSEYVSPVAFQMVYLGLENHEQSFAWLERAYEERRGWLAYLKVEPMLDPLRADPRFGEFVRRMKL